MDKCTINLDNPAPHDLRLSVISRNLSNFGLEGFVGPNDMSLAQLSVNVAMMLREASASARSQMAGLLYFGSTCFLPSPMVPLVESEAASSLAVWGSPLAARVQVAIYRKFGANLEYDRSIVQAVRAELDASVSVLRDRPPIGYPFTQPAGPSNQDWSTNKSRLPGLWEPSVADWVFQGTAIVIAREISSQAAMQVTSECSSGVASYRWMLRPAPLKTDADLEQAEQKVQSSAVELAEDLRQVFAKHGFDPKSEAFKSMMEQMEALEQQGVDPSTSIN